MEDGLVWLIEVTGSEGNPYYLCGFTGGRPILTANAWEAKEKEGYAGRADAQRVIDFYNLPHARAIQHGFERPAVTRSEEKK